MENGKAQARPTSLCFVFAKKWNSTPGLRRPLRFTGLRHRCLCWRRPELLGHAEKRWTSRRDWLALLALGPSGGTSGAPVGLLASPTRNPAFEAPHDCNLFVSPPKGRPDRLTPRFARGCAISALRAPTPREEKWSPCQDLPIRQDSRSRARSRDTRIPRLERSGS